MKTLLILLLPIMAFGQNSGTIRLSNSSTYKIAVVKHQMPNNTNGGSYPLLNTWQPRPWNIIEHDEIGVSIDTVSNSPWFDDYRLVIPAGRYILHYNSIIDFNDDYAQMRIYNVTDDSVEDMDLIMIDGDVPETGGGFTFLDFDATKMIMVEHISDGSNSNGFGDITQGTDPQWDGHALFARITLIKID